MLVACCTPAPSLPNRTPAPSVPPVATAEPTPSPTAEPTPAYPAPPADGVRARVARVIDGDTVVLHGLGVGSVDRRTGGRRARLIGIDTPEVHGGVECLGREASAFTKRSLDGREVIVSFDVDTLDRYGRALVYVWETDGTFFNGRIVAEGYAYPYTVPPNVRYAEVFVRLAAAAREAGRGLWARC